MRKILIRNRAEPEWSEVIEARLRLMLGSMLGHINQLEVEFDVTNDEGVSKKTYSCTLVVVEDSGERFLFRNHQADGNLAIDGATARARRSIVRLKRSQAPSRWLASAW
jgi:hypothetical protein